MPKELKEIKNFNTGVILNASERDTPPDAPAYSLNINPNTEEGLLDGIETNRFVFTLQDDNRFIKGVPWGESQAWSIDSNYNVGFVLNNISMFEDVPSAYIYTTGTKGIREKLLASSIEPISELKEVVNTLTNPDDTEGNTGYTTYIPGATYTSDAIEIVYTGDEETIEPTGATATITITDVTEINNGDKVNLIATDSTSHDFTAGDVAGGGTWVAETDNNTTATNLATQINANAKFSASADSAVVTVTQATAGTTGSTTVTLTDSGTAGMSKTDFTTALVVTGFTEGTGTITVKNGTVKTDLDGEKITIKTSDGKQIVYQWDNDGSGPDTGEVINSTECCIQLSGTSNQDDIAVQLQLALSSMVDSDADNGLSIGHGYRLETVIDTSGSDAIVTVRQTQTTLNHLCPIDSYYSFSTQTAAQFNGKTSNEYFKTVNIDEDTKTITIKRGCFGSRKYELTSGTAYNIFSSAYKIGTEYVRTTNGTVILSKWNIYSGNNIGSNLTYDMGGQSGFTTTAKMDLGFMEIDGTGFPTEVVFSNTNKTMTVTGSNFSPFISETDKVTIYYGGNDAINSGRTFTINKIETNVWTFDEAPGDDTVASGNFYMEKGVIKNPVFHHQFDLYNSYDVGASNQYKFSYWWNKQFVYADTAEEKSVTNRYDLTTTTNVVAATGGVSENTTSILGKGSNKAAQYYPFQSTSACAQINADYRQISTSTFSVGISDTTLPGNYISTFSKNDIMYMETSGVKEYMLITYVTDTETGLNRGYLGTTVVAHTNKAIFKNINSTLGQTISKDELKSGQSYYLCFYAKTENSASGAISVKVNGGYITSNGKWKNNSEAINLGFETTYGDVVMQEDRWIDFEDISNLYNDTGVDSSGNEVTLDSTFRKFELKVILPIRDTFDTDMDIEFVSKGVDASDVWIDMVTLVEYNSVMMVESDSEITTMGYINKSGIKDLVVYDGIMNKLKISRAFNENSTYFEEYPVNLSPFTDGLSISTNNRTSLISRNREIHASFGSEEGDSNPQWLGYLNHNVFGQNVSDTLYQDEDTVHKYNESGASSVSKLCVAGEFEYIDAIWNGSDTLTITMPGTNLHRQNPGDNIIVRQWGDTTNNWDGAGVWFVDALDGSNPTTKFTAKRRTAAAATPHNEKDNNPTAHPGGINDSEFKSKICFRPYYYYGIREGDSSILRISPEARVISTSAVDTEYVAGTTENSYNLGFTVASISTCYSKDSVGSQGGYLYVLDKNAINDTEVYIHVVDICKPWNSWKADELVSNILTVDMRPFHWANYANMDGNERSGSAIGYGAYVSNKLASARCPIIKYSGIPSDILETKGPNQTYTHKAVNPGQNTPSAFDTRVWIQMRPAAGATFTEGNRFLFCARTEDNCIGASKRINGADRTPCTTLTYVNENYTYEPGQDFQSNTYKYSMPGGHKDLVERNKHDVYKFYSGSWNNGKSVRAYWLLYEDGVTEDIDTFQYAHQWKGRTSFTGDNIGWLSEDRLFTSGVSISVARYGLFGIADNDGDGLLDGTGVVVPSVESLPSTYDTDKFKYGPYGHEGTRVSAHAVGLIGSGNGNKWLHRGGGWQPEYGSDDDSDAYMRMTRGKESEEMFINNCIFICTDIHWGDKRDGTGDGAIDIESLQGGSLVGTRIWDGAQYLGTKSQNFSKDDAAAIAAGDTDGWAVDDDDDDADGAAGISDGAANGWQNNFNCTIFGGVTGSGAGHDHDASDDVYHYHVNWKYDIDANPSKHPHYYWDKEDALNPDIYTEVEIENDIAITNPGAYTYTWWTAPTQMCDLNGRHDNDNTGGLSDDAFVDSPANQKTPYWPNWTQRGFCLPRTQKVDRLNYRSGFLIRPLKDEIDINWRSVSVSAPITPDTVYHVENPTYASAIYVDGAIGAATEVATNIDIQNSGLGGVVPYADVNDLKQWVLGQNIYKASGVFVGYCTSVTDTNTIVVQMLETTLADEDRLYLGYSHYSRGAVANGNAYKLWMGVADVDDESGEYEGTSKLYSFQVNNQYPTIDFTDQSDAKRYTGTIDVTYAETNGFLNGWLYEPTDLYVGDDPDGTITTYSLGKYNAITSKYHVIRLHKTGIKGGAQRILDGYQLTVLGKGYGSTNMFVGNMITIIDKDTGHMQTRYIVGSEYVAGDNSLYISIHYPLGHTPVGHNTATSADKFFIWSHAKACVAPFIKDVPMAYPYDFHGDATEFTVYPNSVPAAENPLTLQVSDPSIMGIFGGLDARRLRKSNVHTVTDSTDNMVLTLVPAAHSKFAIDDTISLDAADATDKGHFPITAVAADTVTAVNADTIATNNTNYQKLTTNQWEITLADKGGGGTLSEVRQVLNAGIARGPQGYDTSLSFGNLNRSDYPGPTDADTAFIKGGSEAAVTIAAGSSSDATEDYFLKDTDYRYKISLVYDGYQEGPLSSNYWIYSNGVTTVSYVDITINIKQYSHRLTSVNLYRRDNAESFYRLIKAIPTKKGWNYIADTTSYQNSVRDDGSFFGTYESRTGMNETINNIAVKYGLATEIDGYLFVGDCAHENIKNASNQIFRSRPGKYSLFDWTRDFIVLKSKPTALTSFNGRLYVFDATNTYKINPHTLQIEDTFEGIGCLNQEALIVTEFGLFFADKNGAYMHNGQIPAQISKPIYQGGDTDLTWASKTVLKDVSWYGLLTTHGLDKLKVTFDASTLTVLFLISSNVYNVTLDIKKTKNYIWAYSITSQRWDLWELEDEVEVGKPFIGERGILYIPLGDTVYEFRKGPDKKYYTWLSKKLTLGNDSIMKVYNKIKVNGLDDNLQSGGTNAESSNRLLIQTSEGVIPSASITYADKISDSEYKLKGSLKKGRWVQLLIENINKPIDSLGVIFRRKTTK